MTRRTRPSFPHVARVILAGLLALGAVVPRLARADASDEALAQAQRSFDTGKYQEAFEQAGTAVQFDSTRYDAYFAGGGWRSAKAA